MTTLNETPSPEDAETAEAAEQAAREASYKRLHGIIVNWLRVLTEPNQCLELRCLNVTDGDGDPGSGRTSTQSGWFDGRELEAIATTALQYSDSCSGVYYTLNPLKDRWGKRARMHRGAPTRLDRSRKNETACDADVIARRWFMVDVDPVRAKGHEKDSATDGEKDAALEVVHKVRDYLTSLGWPEPVLSDSGNGYHLLYKIEDADVASTTPVLKGLLQTLSAKFSTPFANVDQSVYNPSRIVKLPGTRACKGKESEDRPWRRARILELPE